MSQKLDHTFPSTALLYCIILNTHHCSPGDSPELTYELSNVTVEDCLIIILSKTGAVHLFTFSAMLMCSLVYKAVVNGQHMSSVFRFEQLHYLNIDSVASCYILVDVKHLFRDAYPNIYLSFASNQMSCKDNL